MQTPRVREGRFRSLVKPGLIAAMVFIVFSGNRCEKQPRANVKTKTAASAADAAVDAAKDAAAEPAVDAADLAETPADGGHGVASDGAAGDVSDVTVESAEAAAPKIKFKKVPKIPSLKPSDKQPVADPIELEYLTDHEKTNRILAEGKWTKKQGEKTLTPMKRERVSDPLAWRFKILLAISDEDEPITGFFKPRQESYWDWLKEIHAYNIGALIGAPTVPTVMRFFSKNSFSWWLNKTPADETTMFKWEGKKEPRIRGALKYWVPSYWHRRIGAKVANEEYMTAIAKSIHPANRKKLEKDYPVYLEMGRGIVFDYLIINEDRPENLGTLLMPDGSYKLVFIDNGLALGVEHGGRTVMKNMFLAMRMFPRDMIDRIRDLEDADLWKLLRPPDDPVMWLPEVCVEQLIKRRDFIVKTVDEWHEKWGDIIWY
jgi:hypothetical protein